LHIKELPFKLILERTIRSLRARAPFNGLRSKRPKLVLSWDQPLLFESNPNPMWIYDVATHAFLAVNDTACKHYGYSRSEFLLMTVHDIRPVSERAALAENLAVKPFGLSHSRNWRHRCAGGEVIDVEVTSVSVVYDGHPARLVLASDVTHLRDAERQLVDLARRDPLTNLLNRAGLEHALTEALELVGRRRSMLAIVFLDLNNFKAVNDSFGHETGDTVLKAVAERLRIAFRNTDPIARYGGDEFIVLIPDLLQHSEIEAYLARLTDVLSSPIAIGAQQYHMGASIGVSIFPENGADPQALLNAADAAMYRAKRQKYHIQLAMST